MSQGKRMDLAPRALYLPTARGRLFAVFHPASQPRAGVLMFPPFLQEHALSLRLFAVLADELARRGIAVLRPDYYGTCDSDGDDLDFSLDQSGADARVAFDALRARIGALPVIALGARGGSFIAAALAAQTRLQALWLWQPVTDGAAYLAQMRRIDAAERQSTTRYPNGVRTHEASPQETLLGFPCAARLFAEFQRTRLEPDPCWPELTVLLDRPEASTALATQQRIELPPLLTAWEYRLNHEHIPAAATREVAARLAATMGIA